MNWKMVYRPFVKQDLHKAIHYYKAISPNLAKDFLNRVREAEKYIFWGNREQIQRKAVSKSLEMLWRMLVS